MRRPRTRIFVWVLLPATGVVPLLRIERWHLQWRREPNRSPFLVS